MRSFRFSWENPEGTWIPLAGSALAGGLTGYLLVSGTPTTLFVLLAGIAGVILLFLLPLTTFPFLLFILLIGEGALRKWVFPSAQEWIYFGKDIVILVGFFRILLRREPADPPLILHPPLLRFLLLLLILYLGGQFFNPRSPSLILTLFGLRGYLLPLLSAFLFLHIFTPKNRDLLIKALLTATILLAILATIQSLLPADHPLNRYVGWSGTRIATLGIGKDAPARTTATFSYITGYTDFLYFAFLLVLSLLAEGRIPRWKLTLILPLILYQMILTGSRAVLVLAGSVWVLFSLLNRNPSPGNRRAFFWGFPLAILFLLLFLIIHPSALRGIKERWDVSDFGDRLRRIFLIPLEVAPSGGLMGYGPGTLHQSRDYLLARTGELNLLPPLYEEESARVVLEIGAIGAILWFGFWIVLLLQILSLLFVAFREKKRVSSLLALSLFTLHLLLTGIIYKTATAYLWALLMGMTLGVPHEGSTHSASQEE